MSGFDRLDLLFIVWAFFFQIVLLIHFALRRWAFERYILRWGWIVYALALPALAVSLAEWRGGKPWALWLGGVIYAVWAAFGGYVEYVRKIEWRSPVRAPIFGPYVLLYLATNMFYWFPLGLLSKPLWYVYGILFVGATLLNAVSHRGTPAGGGGGA